MPGLGALGSWPEKGLNRGITIICYKILSCRDVNSTAVYLQRTVNFSHDNVLENLGHQITKKRGKGGLEGSR